MMKHLQDRIEQAVFSFRKTRWHVVFCSELVITLNRKTFLALQRHWGHRCNEAALTDMLLVGAVRRNNFQQEDIRIERIEPTWERYGWLLESPPEKWKVNGREYERG